MKCLKLIGKFSALYFTIVAYAAVLTWADAARTRPVFEGIPSWYIAIWYGSAILSVVCFLARLRIVERVEVKRVARHVVRGRKVREVVIEG